MLGSAVTAVRNFEKDTITDVEGDKIPQEKMLIFELADRNPDRGARLRHGAENQVLPFRAAPPGRHEFTPAELAAVKPEVEKKLDALWQWLQEDARPAGRGLTISGQFAADNE